MAKVAVICLSERALLIWNIFERYIINLGLAVNVLSETAAALALLIKMAFA